MLSLAMHSWLRRALVASAALGLLAGCPADPDAPNDIEGGSSPNVGGGGMGGSGGLGGSGGSELCADDCSAISPPTCHVAVCNDGSHPGTIGQCVVVQDTDGVACDDGAFCTTTDTCQAGVCTGGPPNDCGMTAGECEEVVCDESSDTCQVETANQGMPCTSDDLCVTGATCQAGICAGGDVKDCFFAPVPNDCHVAVCNPQNGMCEPVPGNDGSACSDASDLCTLGKTCSAGQCSGGSPKDCSHLTQACDIGICDTTNGQCTVMAGMNGQVCDDLDACTTGEICTAGTCGGGTAVTTCELLGDGCCPANCTAANDYDCNCFGMTLTTSYTSTSGWDGVMFDVAAVNTLKVLSFDANIDPGSKTIEIYYKSGTHVGFESNAAAWTLAGSALVNPAQANVGTPIPVAVNLTIPAGQTYAFYVVSTAGGTLSNGINYIVGVPTGSLWMQDANLQIFGGKGRGTGFAGSSFVDRGFSGSIHYEKCGQ